MTEDGFTVERHRTAIHRITLSRPIRLAREHGVLTSDQTIFDYGCGHGDDIVLLLAEGFAASGWDPFHFNAVVQRSASIVNLGYVLNVIEDLNERRDALLGAWQLTESVLIVSARTTIEDIDAETFGDGKLTAHCTFQKFYTQSELQDYVRQTLDQEPVAVAPGVFFVFRHTGQRESYLAANARRAPLAARPRQTDVLYAEHQTALDTLAAFVSDRGRLPTEHDAFDATELTSRLGSVKRAFLILKRVFSREHWLSIAEDAKQDLLVYLALAKFRGRSKFHDLDAPLQRDMKALFGSYTKACEHADRLLFSAGNNKTVEEAFATSPIGKRTPGGLYVHRSALMQLSPVLRVYEGCARVLVGDIEGANVIKLHRSRFAISYLYYPDFETDAHPSLVGSAIVFLASRDVRFRDYSKSENPPILHRKETFVTQEYPLHCQFEALTRAEEAYGLYEDTTTIGFRLAWAELLKQKGLAITAHEISLEP